jgi:WD40 repeat protein/serine/threonine protein kinase/Flp pilus assembly protein TadD
MPADLQRARELFLHAVGKLPPEQWDAYLAEVCGPDGELRQQVAHLLQVHREAGSFLERPAEGVGATGPFAPAPKDAAAVPTEAAGTAIGPYKLIQAIGEGGMGAVWMAQQTAPIKRLVALKVIKAGMDSKQVLARFEAERQALALMDHPNIARVLDAGTTGGGRPFFVMELVKGVPITRYCDEHRLTPRQRLELFVPVCQAVQHAHQKGIIHRDLKPSNILVAQYDGRPVPKVIDFGIAKATGQQLTEHTLVTGFGAVVGTLEYMSPEQAELNQLDIDTRSDIYSLGVLLYELLTGTTPLDRKRLKEAALLEVLRLIREEEPPRPSTRLSTTDELPSVAANRGLEPKKLSGLVRGELDWIVMKALEKDRNRRYETANGFAMDVQRYLHDEPIQAGRPSTMYRLRKFARRNKGVLTAAALVSAALVLAVVVLAISNVRINDALGQAKTNAETADQRAEDLARRLYIDQVNLAHLEVVANNVTRADALLADCEPSRRGWEWVYTKRLCHLEAMTLGGFPDHAAAVVGARCASPATLALLLDAHDPDGTIAAHMASRNGSVRSVAYSPDGRRIASAHDDGSIVLWDARTGQEIRSLTGHLGGVTSVTFDDDGGRLISGGYDGTVRVWDANTGQKLFVLRGHSRPVMSVAFRPGANQAASCEYGGFKTFLTPGLEIKQWDLLRGQEIRTLHHAPGWNFSWVAFTPDGQRLLSSAGWSGQLHIWDATSGEKLEARPHPFPSSGLSVSPADGRIAFGYQDGTVGLSGPGLGRDLQSLRGHSSTPVLAFSRDGTRLASGGEDGTIEVWSVADGREVTHLRGHTDRIRAIAFSPKGNSLASGSEDGTVKIWHIAPARDPYPLNIGVWVNRVRFALDGRRTAIASSRLRVDDTTSNRTLFQIDYSPGLGALAFSRDGRLIATGASDQVRLLDAETGQSVANSQRHAGVQAVAFGAGNLLASAGDDGTVRFWDGATGQAGAVLDAHKGGIFSLAFDPAGTMLASLALNGTVCLWDAPKGRLIRSLVRTVQRDSRHSGDALAFSPDGRRLAVACADGTVHVWEVASGDEVFTLRGQTQGVTSVAYSPDGRRIAAAGWDHTIKLWDAATGDEVFTLRGHTGGVLGLAFSPDGFRLLSAGADCKVRAWDATPLENKPAATLEPRSATEWNDEGAWYATQHLWDEAVHACTKAIELEPDFWEAWHSRGLAYVNLHKDDKALADFTKAIELKPKYVPAITNRATTYLRLRQYDKAIADYSDAILLEPKRSELWSSRGFAYLTLKKWDKCIQDYTKAIELAPHVHTNWWYRGLAYRDLGQWDKLAADYSKLLEKYPNDYNALYLRAVAYVKLNQPELALADLRQAVAKGYTQLQEIRNDDRIALLRTREDFRKLLAELEAKATETLRREIALKEKEAVAHPEQPGSRDSLARSHHNLASLLLKLGQKKEAAAAFRQAIAVWEKLAADFPTKPEYRQYVAYSYRDLVALLGSDGQAEEAGKAYRKELNALEKLDAKDVTTLHRRAAAYKDFHQYDKALADFSKAIELNPKDLYAWYQRASVNSQLGRYAAALADYQKLLELAKDDAIVQNDFAWFLATCPATKYRNPARAVELAKKAVELAPKEGNHWNTLGVAHYRAGDWKAAVAALDKSREFSKGGTAFDFIFLAMSHWQLGQKDDALKWYKQAVEWVEKNSQALAKNPPWRDELHRFRAEAKELLTVRE